MNGARQKVCDDVRLRMELHEAARSIACARLVEFQRQAWRLSELVRRGLLDKADIGDGLYEIAVSNGLVMTHGDDRIQALLVVALCDANFHPLNAEVA